MSKIGQVSSVSGVCSYASEKARATTNTTCVQLMPRYTSLSMLAPIPLIQPHVLITNGRSARHRGETGLPEQVVKYCCSKKWIASRYRSGLRSGDRSPKNTHLVVTRADRSHCCAEASKCGTEEVRSCGSVTCVSENMPSMVNSPWPTSRSSSATLRLRFSSALSRPRQNMLLPTFFAPITSVTLRSQDAIVLRVYCRNTPVEATFVQDSSKWTRLEKAVLEACFRGSI